MVGLFTGANGVGVAHPAEIFRLSSGSTPIQKIMKKNIKNTIKQNKPDISVKKIDNIKKVTVVENPIQPVFKPLSPSPTLL